MQASSSGLEAFNRMRAAGMRPGRRHAILAELLFDEEGMTVPPDDLLERVREAGLCLGAEELAETLGEFFEAGLVPASHVVAASACGPNRREVDPVRASRLFKTLANRHRLGIICALRGRERIVGDLAKELNLAQSALSQQLARLRREGLVTARRSRSHVYYRIAPSAVPAIEALLAAVR
ncbi:helix-turn-helix transcriptional regulator [Telmatospirillum sp. J64-1]|uniref:ArsR/SmtB family transcription factor n=1 Tax=Telmatospirillum sp. J64-1 TaxID=2502183 RepID=UPI0021084426|nr:metalloregulator ArsR/SmtB family transcription factor [Telmatospirillum sp. J64-1]